MSSFDPCATGWPNKTRATRYRGCGVLIVLCLVLAACGFEPVHGPNRAYLASGVAVSAPQDRNGYILVRRLEERLGQAADPAYFLDVAFSISTRNRGIDSDGIVRRILFVGVAEYSLRQADNVVLSGQVDAFTAYAPTGTNLSVLASERDAQARLMIILADRILRDLQALGPVS